MNLQFPLKGLSVCVSVFAYLAGRRVLRKTALKWLCGLKGVSALTFRSHRCRNKQIFGGAMDFCPNLPEKFLCDFCQQIFSHKGYKDLFWCDLQKKGTSCVFLQTLGTIFSRISRDFVQIFDKSKLLVVRLHPRLLHHWQKL